MKRARRASRVRNPEPMYGRRWIDGHLLVEVRPGLHGTWVGTVMNNGVVIYQTGGGAGHPTSEKDFERLARQAQRHVEAGR